MRGDDGQAAIEYVAVLALLAAVLAAAIAFRVDPSQLAGTVDRAFARGICVVRGGACDADQQPCVVASEKLMRERHLNIVVASIGKDRYLLRERRSDGTIAITDFRAGRLRIGGSKGGSIRFSGIELGGEISLSLLAQRGSGVTYAAASQRQADALQRKIIAGDKDLPSPRERFGEVSTKRDYGVSGSAGGEPVVGAGFHASDHDGSRVAADGSRTAIYAHGEGWNADVLGRPLAGRDRAETYAVRLDPSGRPLELIVSVSGVLEGAHSLPSSVDPVASSLLARAAGRRLFAVEAHLDLGDPVNAALAARFVDEVRHPRIRIGSVPGPTQQLRERLRSDGTIEVRTYAVERQQIGSADELGLGGSASRERSTLLAAASRSYDGSWRSRGDCLA